MPDITLALIVFVAIDWVIRIVALILVPRNRKPTSAMAWLLAIFLIPYVGVFLYLLIGSDKLPRRRRQLQATIDGVISEQMSSVSAADTTRWPTWLPGIVEMNRELTAIPAIEGNSARLIDGYEQSIRAMADDINTARSFVHVEFYIVAFDDTTRPFFAAMERAVARGVNVRVLLDHVASVRAAGWAATRDELERVGVEWSFMLPFRPLRGDIQRPDLRNHRKLVVIDGHTAYVGSQNLIARDYNSPKNQSRGLQWQELVARVTGPVVSTTNLIFLGDWYCETGERVDHEHVPVDTIPHTGSLAAQVVPSGPGYDQENNLRLFLGLLGAARERIIITSPYFVPNEAMMYAITMAAQRGVDVQLFVSELGDQGGVFHAQRSYYEELLRAGVAIWMYPAPFILHAKHLSIDDDVAVIGSSNMDIRSFNLDLEISLLVYGTEFVSALREVEQDYRDRGRQLTLTEWESEPKAARFWDGIARLTSALQ